MPHNQAKPIKMANASNNTNEIPANMFSNLLFFNRISISLTCFFSTAEPANMHTDSKQINVIIQPIISSIFYIANIRKHYESFLPLAQFTI